MKYNFNGIDIDVKVIREDFNLKLQRAASPANILSVMLYYSSSTPFKYSYTVLGRTPDMNFTYGRDTFATSHQIPIVGLYANAVTIVEVTYESQDGAQTIVNYSFDTTVLDFTNVKTHIEFEVHNEEMANQTIGQGWLITNFTNGYDRNGDLRVYGPYPWQSAPMKTFDGWFFYGDFDPETSIHLYFVGKVYRADLLGGIQTTYAAPDGYAFHHCMTKDNRGNLYILGSKWVNEWPAAGTPEERVEGILYRYDINTGELLWQRDYSRDFDGMMVLVNSDPSDIHFNSLEYIEKYNQIIISARGSSVVMGVDADTGDIIWTIQDPAFPLLGGRNLEIVNTDNFIYPNGQHGVFLCHHEKYLPYWDDGKIVIMIFDNVSCAFPDGTPNMGPIDSPQPAEPFEPYPFDSRIYIMALDLDNYTAELLDTTSAPGYRTEFAGVAFELNQYFEITMSYDFRYFVVDTDHNLGVACYEVDTELAYRSRVFTYDELRKLLDNTVPGSPADYVRHEETDRFRYSVDWYTHGDNPNQYSNNRVTETRKDGATFEFAFEGTAFRIISYKGVSQNTFDVYIDDTFVANVDTYNSSFLFKQIVYENDTLINGPHRVRLVAHTTDAVTRYRVSIDAIEVRGNLLNVWEV